MKRTAFVIMTLGLGCGPTSDPVDTGSNDDTTTNGDGTATDPSATSETGEHDGTATTGDETTGSDETTGGVEPIDPCDTTLQMGVTGVAIEIVCDVGTPEECEQPGAGRMIAAYAEDPRLMADDFLPTELDPAILPVAETTADADGRFELPLEAGTWVLCAVFGSDGFCRTDLVIDDTQPLRSAWNYSGNGDQWTFGTCSMR